MATTGFVALRIPYRVYPLPDGRLDWHAALAVQLAAPDKSRVFTRPFEALVDSGSSICLFTSQLARVLGLSLEGGERAFTVGVSGERSVIYYHHLLLRVAGEVLRVRAAFSAHLPLPGLLGRSGFFDNFRILFDPTSDPAGMELERVYKT